MVVKTKLRVSKEDFERILLSETAPVDISIIFSNHHFYSHMKRESSDNLYKFVNFMFGKNDDASYFPLKYPILKGMDGETRTISLLHPSSQNLLKSAIEIFGNRILNHCSMSIASLRYPRKISSTFPIIKSNRDTSHFKGSEVTTEKSENSFKYVTSYFSYKPFSQLHHFFESRDYLNLESKFINLWSLDISRCFDSIYTHSFSWAVKGKELSQNSTTTYDFGNALDRVMQLSNNRETNGIPVGNEFSRLFVEVILQDVDNRVINVLNEEPYNLTYGTDYVFKRYVDDYYLFFNKDAVGNNLKIELEKTLRFYKLFLQPNKSIKLTRPLITDITRAKVQVNEIINDFLDTTLFEKRADGALSPKRIYSSSKVLRSFIDKVMNACYQSERSYKSMASYCIGAIKKRVSLISFPREGSDEEKKEYVSNLVLVIKVLIEAIFHFFQVNPTSKSSLSISQISYIIKELASIDKDLEVEVEFLISAEIKRFFESGCFDFLSSKNRKFLPVEFSNLLCVSRNICPHHLLSESMLMHIFKIDDMERNSSLYLDIEESCDYFQIIAALYYIGDNERYSKVRRKIISIVHERLKNGMRYFRVDARITYLFLDCMSCPYIPNGKKEEWNKLFYVHTGVKSALNGMDQAATFDLLTKHSWFVTWDSLELWNILCRKEILFGY